MASFIATEANKYFLTEEATIITFMSLYQNITSIQDYNNWTSNVDQNIMAIQGINSISLVSYQ